MAHSDDVCQFHSGIETDISTIKESIKTIELKIDRPPVWLSFVFSGMSFVLGAAFTWIIHLHKITSAMASN
jgi:hypothetical protein